MVDTAKNRKSEQQQPRDDGISPAGAHHKPHLTDERKTPGTGMLPEKDDPEVEGPTG